MVKGVQKGAQKYRAAGALETDCILENLFSHMHADDLKSCRLVCKQWHKFATPALEKRLAPVVLHTAGFPITLDTKGAPKMLEDFDAFATATAATAATSAIDLKRVKFRKFSMDFGFERTKLPSVIVSDWTADIVSLELSGILPQVFNGCILGIMHELTQLKHLNVSIERNYNSSHLYGEIQAAWPQNKVFKLESFFIRDRDYYDGALFETDSGFLKQCQNLKVLSIKTGMAMAAADRMSRWLDAFRNEDYPRGITTLSFWQRCAQWGINANFSYSIAAFLGLFPLKDLRLLVAFSGAGQWDDIVNVLRSIESKKITKLALYFELPRGRALDKSGVTDVFRALSLPQYGGLEDLKIGICSPEPLDGLYTAEVGEADDVNARAAQESFFVLPSIKNLLIKFSHRYDDEPPKKIQKAITEMLKIAAVRMPELKSLSVDAFSKTVLKDVVKVLGGFVNLQELTLNGGHTKKKVRADTLFGIWGATKKNAFKGLFALSKMENLTLIAPPGTHLDKEAFERGFLRMPQLRNLRINDNGLTKISQPELDSLELGSLTIERGITNEDINRDNHAALSFKVYA